MSKHKGVRVENLTELPTREVANIVRWVCRQQDANDPNLLVRVKRSRKGLRGRYYPRARGRRSEFHNPWTGEWSDIEVKVPAGIAHMITIGLPEGFPRPLYYYNRRETPPAMTLESWQEALVTITAHEAKHHWQWKMRHKRANGRRRFQFVETECDFAGYRTLQDWRLR